MQPVVGIDFGTTNSVVACLREDGGVDAVRFAVGTRTFEMFRSVLCFWSEQGRGRTVLRHEAGPAAIAAYLEDPLDSRLIMSMKSYLAQRSFTQTRLFGRPFSLEQLVSLFLRALLAAAGFDPAMLAQSGARIVAGRPVRFAGAYADHSFGETRLRAAYAEAGLPRIEMALEPEGAGYRFARALDEPATVLIGDFGGGTSDFSLLRFAPTGDRRVVALGHGGIGIAGDVFDYRIIDAVIAPLLGRGDTYRIPMSRIDLPVPPEYFSSFARWHLLSLMRNPRTLGEIAAVARDAAHPALLRRLLTLIEDERGYALYEVVSGVKAALSGASAARLSFAHKDIVIERDVTRDEFEGWIGADLARLGAVVDRVLGDAGVAAGAIDHVFLTGGTSMVPAVRRLFAERFGEQKLASGGEFVSVAEGLALIGGDRMRAEAPVSSF
ncbi:MAG TPA: Hsp70 family protein [Acetobacteraceae bacterium]|nr:Hsp70 family protein [Acetobacteraceae bacterium]